MKKDYQLNFNERNRSGRVNIAEEKAVDFFNKSGAYLIRMGNDEKNNPIPYKKIMLLSSELRGMPDFIVLGSKASFCEVKGCIDVLRIKKYDMLQYNYWNTQFEKVKLIFFVYSTKLDNHIIIKFNVLRDFIKNNDVRTGVYEDNNKEYFEIPVEVLLLMNVIQ